MNKSFSIVDIDLIYLIESDLGTGKAGRRWTQFHCPFHRDMNGKKEPTLLVTNGDQTRGPYWTCAKCKRRGDAVAWARDYRLMSFSAALNFLQIGKSPVIRARIQYV